MFFCLEPDRFFAYAQIDVVQFPDDLGGDQIIEKTFKGPLHQQLRSALLYIQKSVLTERVQKLPDVAEANRFFKYTYVAIEEALSKDEAIFITEILCLAIQLRVEKRDIRKKQLLTPGNLSPTVADYIFDQTRGGRKPGCIPRCRLRQRICKGCHDLGNLRRHHHGATVGEATYLKPLDGAPREQIAAVVMRYLKGA